MRSGFAEWVLFCLVCGRVCISCYRWGPFSVDTIPPPSQPSLMQLLIGQCVSLRPLIGRHWPLPRPSLSRHQSGLPCHTFVTDNIDKYEERWRWRWRMAWRDCWIEHKLVSKKRKVKKSKVQLLLVWYEQMNISKLIWSKRDHIVVVKSGPAMHQAK